jgi:hypothetical protein
MKIYDRFRILKDKKGASIVRFLFEKFPENEVLENEKTILS